MSAIFGEQLTFGQEKGPDVRLVVFGDEFYARFENADGYTVVHDKDLGLFCYARLHEGTFVSSGVPITEAPPPDVRRHLRESRLVRRQAIKERRLSSTPPAPLFTLHDTVRTFGPSQGLLPGRRLSEGAVRGLTVLVEFQDVTSSVTKADVSEMLNGQNYTRNGNFCSAREYFRLVSNGKLDYSNEVVGPFKLSQKRQYYTTNLLVREALNLAVASGVNLGAFDSRGEGIVDALNIMYAGQTQYIGQLWPHNSHLSLRFGNVRTDLYLLTSMGRSSADLSIGTFCHENGHLLCRFPDMYDYGESEREGDPVASAGIGQYCLMGSGNHLNNGRTPSPVCGYLRDLAGWCDEEVVLNQSGEFEAGHGDYGTVMKFETDKINEYFVVENRSKIALDQHLPSSGLAVYHCDTSGSNEFQEGTATRHYQCALLQADGHLDLERGVNQGDSTDLFGTITGTALSHMTNPSSRQWDGADSLLILSNVSVPGNSIKFIVGQLAAPGSVRGEASPGLTIPDNDPTGVSSKITIDQPGTVKQIKISVDITHTYIGDLVVELAGPSGQQAILHNRAGASRDNLVTTYDSAASQTLAALVGQPARGDWVLRVRDVAGQDIGRLNRWNVEIGIEASDPVIRAESTPHLNIPDNDPAGVGSVITIEQPGTIRQAKVSVDITHTYIGDLRIELLSPSGRRVILHSRLGGSQDDLVATYDTTSSSVLLPFIGQSVRGNWVLRVTDLAGRDVGTLNRWSLELDTGG